MMICDEHTLEALVSWYRKNRRRMPWREDPTPYHVYVSEIMLQQTRVDTVIPYYERFLKALPDLQALSACDEDRLFKLWEGLGYYSRVRNMQKAARVCVEIYGGQVPASREALRTLPGIGSYTAGAILSIAYHRPEPVVDGNVLRVLHRLLLRETDIADPKAKKALEEELRTVLEASCFDPSLVNQALMELGALVCVPNGEPKCEACPWKDRCRAHLEGRCGDIPFKSVKAPKKTVLKTLLFLVSGDRVLVCKNAEESLLYGLYGFPSLPGEVSGADLRDRFPVEVILSLPAKKHVFTHLIWQMNAFVVRLLDTEGVREEAIRLLSVPEGRFVTLEELEKDYPVAAAYKKWDLKEIIK